MLQRRKTEKIDHDWNVQLFQEIQILNMELRNNS